MISASRIKTGLQIYCLTQKTARNTIYGIKIRTERQDWGSESRIGRKKPHNYWIRIKVIGSWWRIRIKVQDKNEDYGSGSRIRITDQEQGTGSSVMIKDHDLGFWCKIRIKGQNQESGSQLNIKDGCQQLFLRRQKDVILNITYKLLHLHRGKFPGLYYCLTKIICTIVFSVENTMKYLLKESFTIKGIWMEN